MSAKSEGVQTGNEAKTCAAQRVPASTTMSSEAERDNLKRAPKGEWMIREVADYASCCMVDQTTQ